MSVPPSFGDLGSTARGLFEDGYIYGLFRLGVKTKTQKDVGLAAESIHDRETGEFNGSVEAKYEFKDQGITLGEKWDTANTLTTEVGIADKPVEGLEAGVSFTFCAVDGKKTGELKGGYKREYLNLGAGLNFEGALINGSLVTGNNGVLAGANLVFDPSSKKIAEHTLAAGYEVDDFNLFVGVKDANEVTGSIYQKVKSNLDVGLMITRDMESKSTEFGIGAKYSPDEQCAVRGKVNNSSQLGMSFETKVREGMTLTLSALINGKNFNSGGHKVGVGLDFEG